MYIHFLPLFGYFLLHIFDGGSTYDLAMYMSLLMNIEKEKK